MNSRFLVKKRTETKAKPFPDIKLINQLIIGVNSTVNIPIYLLQTIKRPKVELEIKLAEAVVRRKELEEEKVDNVIERSGLERHGKMRSAVLV